MIKRPARPAWPRVLAASLPCVLFLAAALPLILGGNLRGRGAWDQVAYHEPVIREFAADWPRVDLSDYASATTPGYHLALAVVCRWGECSGTGLRLAGAVFALGLVGTLGWWCGSRMPPGRALACCLVLPASLYVFSSGVWLLPDNAAWWLVLVVLLVALRPRVDIWMYSAGGAALLALVLCRQNHVWAAAPLWMAAWLGAGEAGRDPRRLLDRRAARARRVAMAVLATAPAFAAVAYFVWLWGGLTPPSFQGAYHGGNPAAPAFILSLIGVFSVFFAGYALPGARALWREARWVLPAAGAAGALAALIPATSFDVEAGRWTGLWNVVRELDAMGLVPVVRERSVLVIALSALGGAALAAWVRSVPARGGWVVLAAVAGFTAAQAASFQLWQRYNEPFVLMLLAVLAAMAAPTGDSGVRRGWLVVGPATLACTLAALAAAVVWSENDPSRRTGLVPRALEPETVEGSRAPNAGEQSGWARPSER